MTLSAPLLLTGFQRSGTTALALALGDAYAHEGGLFAVNGKLWYYVHTWVRDEDVAGRHLRADEIVHALHRRPPLGKQAPEYLDRCERALRTAATRLADSESPPSAEELRRQILVDAHAGLRRWGDKYNEYMLCTSSIVQMTPEARFILLYRDPNAVARSMLRWTGDRPWRPSAREGCWRKWQHWNDAWLEATSKTAERHLVVNYDDLCSSRDTRRRVADFSGVDVSWLDSVRRTAPGEAPALPKELTETWHSLRERDLI